MWPTVGAMLCHWWRKEGQGSRLQQRRRQVRGRRGRRWHLGPPVVRLLNKVGHAG